MTTPNEPHDPYSKNDPASGPSDAPQYGAPQPPAAPPYGAPQPPASGYPTAPQYGSAPAAPQYGAAPQPQYGAAPQYGAPYGAAPAYGAGYVYPKNSLAVWSLVLAIVGLVLCGFLTAIPAVILGSQAKRAVAAGEANNGGLATAGIIIGWIIIGLTILGVIIFTIAIASSGGWTEFWNSIETDSSYSTY